MPALPAFPDGWHLGAPISSRRCRPGSSAGVGSRRLSQLRDSRAALDDKRVRAIEFRPSARKAVHHVLFAHDATGRRRRSRDGRDGKPGFGGMGSAGVGGINGGTGPLGGWAVGATPQFCRDGGGARAAEGIRRHPADALPPDRKARDRAIHDRDLTSPDRAPERRLVERAGHRRSSASAPASIFPRGGTTSRSTISLTLPVDVRVFLDRGARSLHRERDEGIRDAARREDGAAAVDP